MQEISDIFAADGPLSNAIDGYTPRPAQQEMAIAVSAALASGGRLLVEAGTGTGKTFAYLVPALLSGIRIVISTGTRNLQDQLYNKDMPELSRALGRPAGTGRDFRSSRARGNWPYRHGRELVAAGQP
ncbi:MAG: DEAD/DEAH box helicase [Proteobacteria bacterium]|nr:DEAD/DEAH box helicase [Pseudomonadota bacterium]